MAGLLLGITLIMWAISLVGWVAVSATLLGILALVTGIVWVLVSVGVAMPALPAVRRGDPTA